MTAAPHKDQIIAALKAVAGPDGESDIVSLGLVSEVVLQDGKAIFSIAVPPQRAGELEPLRASAERAAATVPGVTGVLATLTADRATVRPPLDDQPSADAPPSGPAPLHGIRNVTHIVAVASGKGGVGKSTTAVNLALALHGLGLRTGLLDADIYGPSIPRLLGLSGKPELIDNRMLKPMERHGVKTMSIGFLVDEETPMIWRGPMVVSALTQMMRDVDWGKLDIMIIDMPPGTGDAQLTMVQQAPLSGAVIVSTPQDLALIDARKGLNMFRRVNVPLVSRFRSSHPCQQQVP